MKTTLKIAAIAAAVGFGLAINATAQSGPDVLKTKGCTNCHDPEKKKVGPPFKEIAAKNAGKADELTAKVKEGKGHPKVNASEAEIKAGVNAILSTK
ncbi:MAG: c-type cytochrome [Bacillota bacterium]